MLSPVNLSHTAYARPQVGFKGHQKYQTDRLFITIDDWVKKNKKPAVLMAQHTPTNVLVSDCIMFTGKDAAYAIHYFTREQPRRSHLPNPKMWVRGLDATGKDTRSLVDGAINKYLFAADMLMTRPRLSHLEPLYKVIERLKHPNSDTNFPTDTEIRSVFGDS